MGRRAAPAHPVKGVVRTVFLSPVTVCLDEGEEALIPPSLGALQHLLGECPACGLPGSQSSSPEVPAPTARQPGGPLLSTLPVSRKTSCINAFENKTLWPFSNWII